MAIASLAGKQHGVIARTQLTRLGLDRFAIRRRVSGGILHPIHDGKVYAVGLAPLRKEGRYLAAVMGCGSDAVLESPVGGGSLGYQPSATRLEVTVSEVCRRPGGIEVHRTRMLAPHDVTDLDGIPVTSVARTLLDLGAVVRPPDLDKAIDRAERLGSSTSPLSSKFSIAPTGGVARKHCGRRSPRTSPAPRRASSSAASGSSSRRRDISRPIFNALIDGETGTHEVDAYWPEQELAVQLDGFEFHRTRRDRERDAASDAALELAGHQGDALHVGRRHGPRRAHAAAAQARRRLGHCVGSAPWPARTTSTRSPTTSPSRPTTARPIISSMQSFHRSR